MSKKMTLIIAAVIVSVVIVVTVVVVHDLVSSKPTAEANKLTTSAEKDKRPYYVSYPVGSVKTRR